MSTAPPRIDIQQEGYKEKAREAFIRHGSVILSGVVPMNGQEWSDRAADIPSLLWGPSELLLKNHTVAGVHLEHSALKLVGKSLSPHTDGYVWGDGYCDIVILYCEAPSDDGGENFLIDGEELVAALNADTRKILSESLIDHTERKEYGSFTDGAESIVPVLRWKQSGGNNSNDDTDESMNVTASWYPGKRMCMRRMIDYGFTSGEKDDTDQYMSLWRPTGEDTNERMRVQQALEDFDRLIKSQSETAARFRLGRGETLLVDNFRMFHARDAYSAAEGSTERRLWRVWAWTNDSFGLPPEVDHENIAATPVEARADIEASTAPSTEATAVSG